jgi:hypothetical protein
VHRLFLLLVAVLLAIAAACGGSDDDASSPGTEPPTTTTTTTTTQSGGIDTLDGASTNPVSGDAMGGGTALLERVTLGRHEGFDRVVFLFRNHVPGYRISYVEPPLQEDGSGDVVDIDGDAFLQVRMELASGFDLETDEGVMVYKGPRRIEGSAAGTSVIREMVRTGDFEAVLTWAIGLSDRVDFRVLTLASPPRLVVDVRNH